MSDIIKIAEASGEFVYLEDGFLYYEPKGAGVISAHHLRALADELDKRNKKWNEEMDEYFRKEEQT
jgi:hypothetical protein